jgi:hypothetical protein
MGKAPAFDMMLGIMVGSIVSRAITGNAPLVPALAATATLIALHSVLTAFADRWHGLGEMIKGRPPTRHRLRGHKDEAAMRIAEPTNRDLRDDLRHHGMTSSAYPPPNGSQSVQSARLAGQANSRRRQLAYHCDRGAEILRHPSWPNPCSDGGADHVRLGGRDIPHQRGFMNNPSGDLPPI